MAPSSQGLEPPGNPGRFTDLLRMATWSVNAKRVQRIWLAEGRSEIDLAIERVEEILALRSERGSYLDVGRRRALGELCGVSDALAAQFAPGGRFIGRGR